MQLCQDDNFCTAHKSLSSSSFVPFEISIQRSSLGEEISSDNFDLKSVVSLVSVVLKSVATVISVVEKKKGYRVASVVQKVSSV